MCNFFSGRRCIYDKQFSCWEGDEEGRQKVSAPAAVQDRLGSRSNGCLCLTARLLEVRGQGDSFIGSVSWLADHHLLIGKKKSQGWESSSLLKIALTPLLMLHHANPSPFSKYNHTGTYDLLKQRNFGGGIGIRFKW